MDVKDKVAIVTGASSGIGASTARLLGARGAAVVLAARRQDRLTQLQSEIGNALAVKTDVTNEGDCRHLVDQASAGGVTPAEVRHGLAVDQVAVERDHNRLRRVW